MATTKHTNPRTEQGNMNSITDFTPTEAHTILHLTSADCPLGFATVTGPNAASLSAKGLVENAGFGDTDVHRITTAGRIVAYLLRKLHASQD
jgi:hypothetical protein